MDFSSDAPSSTSSYQPPESFRNTESSPAGQSSGYGAQGTPEYSSQSTWTARHGSIAEPGEHKKKRPGPKRDARPAPSEKLERNRQAQRSHRERKELYTKELEAEVQRLKDMYLDTLRERDQAVNACNTRELENRQLREKLRLLRGEGYNDASATPTASTLSPADSYADSVTRHSSFSVGPTGGGSSSLMDYETSSAASSAAPYREHLPASSSFGTMGTPASDHLSQHNHYLDNPLPRQQLALSDSGSSSFHDGGSRHGSTVMLSPLQQQHESRTIPTSSSVTPQPASIDYDELALDFVLTLERPCMTHAHYLMVRAHNKESQDPAQNGGRSGNEVLAVPDEVPRDDENQNISGHTLMASVPSHRHIMEHPNDVQQMTYPEGIQRKDLLKLLGLTSQLEINDAELPPVKAWLRVLQNPRLRELSVQDFADLKARLLEKVHCYRFGAVITEDDIVGTVENILQEKGITCM